MVHGDFAAEMASVAGCLQQALPHTANATQASMLEAYIKHFKVRRHFKRPRGECIQASMLQVHP